MELKKYVMRTYFYVIVSHFYVMIVIFYVIMQTFYMMVYFFKESFLLTYHPQKKPILILFTKT
ncbi:hypothetical protein ABE41_015730 [Fictibacillus arsenicus]|uniref:Uncharacterized protein n=1 Tax=Fictibacillus arsenicus TaxID=255247 RepID=A0A1B1Z7Q9_9BACL|nr:hypothetical protein ABE41_015730 [Fictibacillus arsenicus]